MASFAGQKNPPWARAASNIGGAAQQVQVAAAGQIVAQPAVFTIASTQAAVTPGQYTTTQVAVNPALQQQAVLQQAQIAASAMSQVATVSYPTPRPVGPAGQQGGAPKQRVFTGTVSKLHDNFGFVDEDVFFQMTCVKGPQPKVGDRVLVEASFNPNMPFKWNATRIQVMGAGVAVQQQPPTSNVAFTKPVLAAGIAPTNVPPPNITPSMMSGPPPTVHPPPLMGQTAIAAPAFGSGTSRFGGSRVERVESSGREGNRERRDRSNRRDRSPPARRRSPAPARRRSRSRERRSSPRRSRSPLRKKPALVIRRYNVQVPKISLDMKDASVMTLKSRYSNMYIPSDFFNARSLWVDAFPMYRSFKLGSYCQFHVMHKDVEPLAEREAYQEPADADHLYSAKVMLLSCPLIEDLQHKACALAEDSQEVQEAFQHPTRLLQFLVGMKGKSEPMAIGGPWSPSLDGKNPEGDPRVLINTAIRTTKALTGIDLRGCTQWYRFAEIRYHRPEETHKGRVLPARVETVVLFLPDVWSCQPSQIEWETLQSGYKKLLQAKTTGDKDENQDDDMDAGDAMEKTDPTHYSQLDPKNMKVSDLRKELEARTLSSKGLKSQLIARLTKATKTEQEKEESEAQSKANAEDSVMEEDKEILAQREKEEAEKAAKEEEERKRKEERDRASLERHYTLPPSPAIIVHPSPIAKSGKFDCTVMNLSVLLDYRPEDTKEHSFEVSLFAELFNEMLMRDFGFQLYKALLTAPDKKEEDRSSKDKDGKKEDKNDRKDSDEPAAKKQRTEEKSEDKKEERSKDDRSSSKDKDDDDKKKEKDKDRKRDREERRKDKVKMYTADPALLLAFVYFDLNHTGYILDKDCEEILHMLGLQLTRSQVKKLVQKMVSRDTLSYRKLTDKPVMAEDAEKKQEEKTDVKPDTSLKTPPEDEVLSQGNKPLLSQSGDAPSVDTSSQKKRAEDQEQESGTGLVRHKGALIDVNNILSKLDLSEKTRAKMEAKLHEQFEEMSSLRKSYTNSEQSGQKVADELQRLKRKLEEQTDKRKSAEKSHEDMLRAILSAKGQLVHITDKLTEASAKPKEEPVTPVKVKEEPKVNGE